MKWNSKEPVWFDDQVYRERAKKMSPDALWLRESSKYRAKVSSGCGVGFSSLLVIPTLGTATLGLWASGRTLDLARRKEKVIKDEVTARNLPHYERKKRDTLIPLGISIAVITTIGILDIVCLTGTSTAVLAGVSSHGSATASLLAQHPGQFFTGMWHGIELQAQQFFHFGNQHVAVSLDQCCTTIGANGVHHVAMQGLAAPPGADTTIAQTMGTLKGQVLANFHQAQAAGGGLHATHTAATDKFLVSAAHHGNAATLAGASVGMKTAQTAESQLAQLLIADTGLQGVRTSIKIQSPTTQSGERAGKNPQHLELARDFSADEIAAQVYTQALTGEGQRFFIFLSKAGQPIAQRIVATPASQSCRHTANIKACLKCHFCAAALDPDSSAYYHCCMCSSQESSSYDICEPCVAGRGCSCPGREAEHTLYRKGMLTGAVDYGKLEEIKVRRRKQQKARETADTMAGAEKSSPRREGDSGQSGWWKQTWRSMFGNKTPAETEGVPVEIKDEERLVGLLQEEEREASFIEDDGESAYLLEMCE